jgi:hypothetical protein
LLLLALAALPLTAVIVTAQDCAALSCARDTVRLAEAMGWLKRALVAAAAATREWSCASCLGGRGVVERCVAFLAMAYQGRPGCRSRQRLEYVRWIPRDSGS